MNDTEEFLVTTLDTRLRRITTSEVQADIRQDLLDEMRGEFLQVASKYSSPEEAKREFLEKFNLGSSNYCP